MLTRRHLALSALGLPLMGVSTTRAAEADAPLFAAPLRLTDERILMDVALNGHGPFTFSVNTSAAINSLREDLVPRLGLKHVSTMLTGGKRYRLYSVNDMVVGGAVRQDRADLLSLRTLPPGLDGQLAAGLITTYDSELDFDSQQWRVYSRGQASRPGYTRVSANFISGDGSMRFLVEVKAGGRSLYPVVNTGSPWLLTVDNKHARNTGLWDDTAPYAPMRLATSTFQPEWVRVIRGPDLTIGPATYARPLILLRETPGPETSSLGLGLIRTLNLATGAYPHALWVRRNAQAVGPSPNYPLSGLWLEAQDQTVKVTAVGTGSPAAQAGVRTGDVLDGVASVRAGLALMSTADRPVSLKLRRGGQLIETTFTPRFYL